MDNCKKALHHFFTDVWKLRCKTFSAVDSFYPGKMKRLHWIISQFRNLLLGKTPWIFFRCSETWKTRHCRFSENSMVIKSWKQLCNRSIFLEFSQMVSRQITLRKKERLWGSSYFRKELDWQGDLKGSYFYVIWSKTKRKERPTGSL